VKPSPEFQRHHDIEPPRIDGVAFRPGWRVRSRLDVLRASGMITAAEWLAASEFRNAWERAHMGASSTIAAQPGGGGADPHGRLIAGLGAMGRLRDAERAIGLTATALVHACAVADRPWAEMARAYQCDPHTVRAWTIRAIHALADAWAGAGADAGPRPVG
jgi:hypothetical protein